MPRLRPALNAEEVFESAFGLAQDGTVDPQTGVPDQLPYPYPYAEEKIAG